jgi:hypothetical protein
MNYLQEEKIKVAPMGTVMTGCITLIGGNGRVFLNGCYLSLLTILVFPLQRMGIETERSVNVGGFSTGQKQFLEFHRGAIFLESRR